MSRWLDDNPGGNDDADIRFLRPTHPVYVDPVSGNIMQGFLLPRPLEVPPGPGGRLLQTYTDGFNGPVDLMWCEAIFLDPDQPYTTPPMYPNTVNTKSAMWPLRISRMKVCDSSGEEFILYALVSNMIPADLF